MPDIFDEVKEELRAERARQMWKRLGGPLLALALLVLAGVGGMQGWRWYQARADERAAAAFLAANEATIADGADLKAMGVRFAAIAADAPAGYRTLARLRAAALQSAAGEPDAALATWDAVAGDSQADPLYRGLASLMWALHGIGTQDPARLAARLAPLAALDSPWRASARELQGLLALRQGQADEARRTFTSLAADTTAPPGVRERAQRIAAGLGS